MKKTTILWLILGGLALVVLGVLIGISLPTAEWGGRAMPMMRPLGGHVFGGYMPRMFFGMHWLLMPLFWLGPIAGIVALILVLTRRHPAPPPPPPPAPPASPKAE